MNSYPQHSGFISEDKNERLSGICFKASHFDLAVDQAQFCEFFFPTALYFGINVINWH